LHRLVSYKVSLKKMFVTSRSVDSSDEDTLSLVRRLSQRQNVSALLLIALTLASLFLAGMLMQRNEQAAEIINLAGRQRMLSQRVALYAHHYTDDMASDSRRKFGRLVEINIHEFESAHARLVAIVRTLDGGSELHTLYFGPIRRIDEDSRRFVGFARQVIADAESAAQGRLVGSERLLRMADTSLIQDLDAATFAFQRESESRIRLLWQLMLLSSLLIVVFIALSTSRLVRPMIRKLRDSLTTGEAVSKALKASEAKLHAIIETSPVPLALNDDRRNIVLLNPAFVQTFGYTLQDIPTLSDWEQRAYPDPEYRQWVIDSWRDTVEKMKHEGAKPQPMEFNVRAKSGRLVSVLVSPASTRHSFVGARLVVLYDITARKLAEQQLRIAAIAFESQEAMTITDANQVILKINKAFTLITGYSEEDVIGRTPAILKSGRQDDKFYQGMWGSLNSDHFWEGEIWNRRKSGEVYPEWLSITAVLDEHGKVTHYVAAFTDITQHKQAEDKIQQLAFSDPLTGLPNRRLLLDRLQQALAASTRNKRQGALLFIDLDDFKNLNDTLGHDKGDLLLQQVGQRLATCVREGDTVARLGGDEFVVMLEDLSANLQEAATQTEIVGEKILATLNQTYPLAGHQHHSTPSIGVALFDEHENSVDELLKRADLAMYQAKAAGRNTLRFFDPKMQAVVSARVALEADLRLGLQEKQFLLYYQPQVDGDGRMNGAEALVRWQHPTRGLVSPLEFISLAEETGLILPLGYWVLETACDQLVAWAGQPDMAGLVLAVNVSAKQFRHRDFVGQVRTVLECTGADPAKLKLELTESLLLENVEDIIAKMTALKAIGVSFSLDDFGTGYSSLSYLKRLPLDQLKIDQSFVRDVLTDPNDASIAKTIVALAQSLGLAVIAEGVETTAQRDFLASHGCHSYQGYLFGRPGLAENLFNRAPPAAS